MDVDAEVLVVMAGVVLCSLCSLVFVRLVFSLCATCEGCSLTDGD